MSMNSLDAEFSSINLARCLRWHPNGINSWSLSDWATALLGEVGEVCEVVDTRLVNPAIPIPVSGKMLRDELGDVYAYADLFATAAGEQLALCIWRVPPPSYRRATIYMDAVALASAAGKLCDIVKKMNRNRDGLQGNRQTPQELRQDLRHYLGMVGRALETLAGRQGYNIALCVVEKFNQVSEKLGFPERA